MPVNSEHPEYSKRAKQWMKCHDVIEGADQVKEKGQEYLPILTNQTEAQYSAYKLRATFYAATSRTVQGLVGAIFRKPAHIIYPDTYKDHTTYLTTDGLNIEDFAQEVANEIISVGRIGLLIDVGILNNPNDDRAYIAVYIAESIVNWEVTKIGNKDVLTKVVLKEKYKVNEQDEFDHESKTQYRVLRLSKNKAGTAMIYTQEVWRKTKDNETYSIMQDMTTIPTRGGVPLEEIPFIFINNNNLTPSTSKPPLGDLVEVNLSHYRSSADIEHGAHFTALPTPWVAGFPAGTKLSIGSGVAWVTEATDAKAGMLEYTGQGLSAIEKRLESKEKQMAVLGARMLEEQKAGVESEGAMRLRGAGEGGALGMSAKTISSGIQKALVWVAWWSKIPDQELKKIEYKLNNDYSTIKLSSQDLTALMQVWQGGGISQDTFLYNLKMGELLPDDRSIEDEKNMIDAETGGAVNNLNPGSIPVRRNFTITNDPKTGKPVGIQEAPVK